MASPPPSNPDTILFRAPKKRKIYRQRSASLSVPTDDDAGSTPRPDETAPAAPPSPELPSLLRLRKQRRRGLEGVEFRAESQGRVEAREVVEKEEEGQMEGGGGGVVRRFAPQTGWRGGDIDRHMMAYIDSELAKRRAGAAAASNTSTSTAPSSSITGKFGRENTGTSEKEREQHKKDISGIERQPAALGKLLEIDLGEEARNRNVELTEQARRRLGGEVLEEEEEEKRKGKVRLGPDGKPWRGRKRRTSEDIKRDKLVEDILRENRLEIYEGPLPEQQVVNDDQAADDRIAEEFRREFMDAVSQRQRKKAAPSQPPSRGPGGKKEEELKGPKLGGSRSARAAMRETLLKSAKK